MGETMIKGKRKGDTVPFSSLSTTGEITKLPKLKNTCIPYYSSQYSQGSMSLYSPLIPLVYVSLPVNTETIDGINIDSVYESLVNLLFEKKGISKEEWNKVYKDKFYKHPMRNIVWKGYCKRSRSGKDSIIEGSHVFLKEHLSFDGIVDLGNIRNSTFSKKDQVTDSFSFNYSWRPWSVNKFNFRSYSGYVAPYSIWINDGRQYNPHIIAVIRAEDWAYQRLYMLLHDTIDISKVVILVDNRVDSTSFPYNAFRGFYKEQLEPELKKLSCPVFKVPHEYIMENCFIQQFRLQEKNIFKRKQAVEELIDGFYSKYGEKPKEEIKPINTEVVSPEFAEVWAENIIRQNPIHPHDAFRSTLIAGRGVVENSDTYVVEVPLTPSGEPWPF